MSRSPGAVVNLPSSSHCGLVRHWDGGVGGPGGRLDGLPLRGRDDEDAVGGQVGVDPAGLAALDNIKKRI